jgi:DHA2 family multidrug resistance protein
MSDFFWPLIFRGAGLGLVFIPLTNLSLADLPMHRIPNGTGLFNLMRQLGGSVGIAVTATLISRFHAINHAQLAEQVTMYSEPTRERLAAITARLVASGAPPVVAQSKALAVLDLQVTRQAMMLSYAHIFQLFGIALACALPLLFLMKRPRGAAVSGASH